MYPDPVGWILPQEAPMSGLRFIRSTFAVEEQGAFYLDGQFIDFLPVFPFTYQNKKVITNL
jgi:hypothetical protein